MKLNTQGLKLLGFLMVLMFASCGGEAVPPADTAQVVGLIQQDARAVADNPNVSNEMALIDLEGRTNADPARGDLFAGAETNSNQMVTLQAPDAAGPMDAAMAPMVEPMMTDPKAPAKVQRAPMQMQRAPSRALGSSITVGSDRVGQRVSPRLSQKITVVIKAAKATYIDITLYAVPVGSARPAMNANSLIGFAKNFDVVGGQAQFTRYWNGSTSRGTFLRKGSYNIYMAYTYKNGRGSVLGSGGRYWGGNTPISIRVE